MSKHTPTPWVVNEVTDSIHGTEEGKPYSIVVADCPGYQDKRKANAAFIARACNAYDDLIEMVDNLSASLENVVLTLGREMSPEDKLQRMKLAKQGQEMITRTAAE